MGRQGKTLMTGHVRAWCLRKYRISSLRKKMRGALVREKSKRGGPGESARRMELDFWMLLCVITHECAEETVIRFKTGKPGGDQLIIKVFEFHINKCDFILQVTVM